jgi:chloramphenicol 3-O-phosphotransferase
MKTIVRPTKVDFNAEVDSYFDESSLSGDDPPRLAIVMGGPASGKTTHRKARFATGYVLVDAADVFLRLAKGEYLDFPDDLEQEMEIVGSRVAVRAIAERRQIVTELIAAEYEATVELIEAMRDNGYQICVEGINCDVEEAQRRNLARGEDNISCYYAEPFQRRWLCQAAAVKRVGTKGR